MQDRDPYTSRRRRHRRMRFYRHLRIYLLVNGLHFFLKFMDGDFFGWYPLAFFWGLGLAVHYVSVFGWPDGVCGRNRDDYDPHRYRYGRSDRPSRPDRPKRAWRDRDLV